MGAGIYLSSSTGDNLTSNTIDNVKGGTRGPGDRGHSGGADQVGFGIYLDGSSQNNYLGAPGLGLNTLDGDPILYFYNMTGLVIENCTLTAHSNPTNYGKIALISCTNCRVENNTIGNYVGMSGSTGGFGVSGGAAGVGAGIYLSSSTGDNLTSNTIDNIRGGTGGTGGNCGSGGVGGVGAGIYLSSSTGNNLTSNTIDNIRGGTGGLSGSQLDGYHDWGGADQVGFGIYLDGSSQNNYLGVSGSEFNTLDGDPILYFYNMTGLVIENCTLTAHSNPTNYGKIALISCTNCRVENNIVGNYVGMSGSTGGYCGSGDAGDVGAGIYLSSSTEGKLTSNTIDNIWGGTGGTGGYYYGSGGAGGVGVGIYLASSTGDNLASNTIDNIRGGTGGFAGYMGSGGVGGVGAGIYLSSSTGDNLTSNTIDNTQGGSGGFGGYGGSGGAGGVGYGFYLESSDNNLIIYNQVESNITGSSAFNIYLTGSDNNEIFRNSFLDDGGAFDDRTNTWFDTSENEGNWWGNWQAPENTMDANNDGVLDNFYFFIGGQDNYPLSLVTLKAPDNQASTNDNTVTLKWTIPVLSVYTVQVDDNSNFLSPEYENTIEEDITEFDLQRTDNIETSELGEGTYYWHVKARTSNSDYETISPVWEFTVDLPPPTPLLVWPHDKENLNDNTPNLDWDTVSDFSPPVLYRAYVAIDPSFLFIGKDSGWVLDDNWEVTALPDGVYYWRVQAKDNAGNVGENSLARSFQVDTVAPAAPQLVSPIHGENTNDNTPLLDWNTVSENSLPVLYYAAVSDNSDFPYENENSGWITADNWEVTSELPDGVWYWHVRAKDNAGNVGPFSPTWTLTVVTPPWTGTASFSMLDLYTLNVEKILDLNEGSRLVVKFYTYADAFENENVIENFSTLPWHVEENESARHPEGIGVKKVRLDLTTDDTENVISIIASFVVRRSDLMKRISAIKSRWPYASPPERSDLMKEISGIKGQWSFAPA